MKNSLQFHRGRESSSGENTSETSQSKSKKKPGDTAPFLPEESFSEFLLSSPFAGSELSITRDYVIDREIEIRP